MISRNNACCFDCRFADLVRYEENNPVIAVCERTGQRDVAKRYVCRDFEAKRGVVRVRRLYNEQND